MTTLQQHGTGPVAHAAGPRPPELALSIQQPWAWAIAHGPKRIENRTWTRPYRGPIAIHASRPWDENGEDSPLVRTAWANVTTSPRLHPDDRMFVRGAVIAVADLIRICTGDDCECGPWAARDQYHWHLTNIVALCRPILARGHLGLWAMPDPVRDAVAGALTRGEVHPRG